jgi:hypothetical protein
MEVDEPTTVSSPSGAIILLLLSQEKYIPIIFTKKERNGTDKIIFYGTVALSVLETTKYSTVKSGNFVIGG